MFGNGCVLVIAAGAQVRRDMLAPMEDLYRPEDPVPQRGVTRQR